ncbi:MAG: hypothetical protein AAFQ11_04465, partial [Pseudomonadota bacterium]
IRLIPFETNVDPISTVRRPASIAGFTLIPSVTAWKVVDGIPETKAGRRRKRATGTLISRWN